MRLSRRCFSVMTAPRTVFLSAAALALGLAGCGDGSGGGHAAGGDASGGGAGGGGAGGEPGPPPPTAFDGDGPVPVAITLPEADWAAVLADPTADVDHLAQVTFGETALTDVGLSVRGSGSALAIAELGSDRFNLTLDLNDHAPDQTLFGEKKLYLNQNYKDPTHLREVLAYEAMAAVGAVAPRAILVDLTINGEPKGIYTAVEAVDAGFLSERFADADGVLYALEGEAGTLVASLAEPPVYPGLSVERGETDGEPPADFAALVAALSAPGDAAALAQVLDLDRTLRYLAASAVLVDLDSYLGSGANYLLYGRDGVFAPIAVDAGESFGRHTCGCTAEALLDLPIDEPVCDALVERPLVDRLLAEPTLRARYRAHVETALTALAALPARISALAAAIRPSVMADPAPLYSAEDFEWSLTQDLPDPRGGDRPDIFGLLRFVSERSAAVRAQLDGARPADRGGEGACP